MNVPPSTRIIVNETPLTVKVSRDGSRELVFSEEPDWLVEPVEPEVPEFPRERTFSGVSAFPVDVVVLAMSVPLRLACSFSLMVTVCDIG